MAICLHKWMSNHYGAIPSGRTKRMRMTNEERWITFITELREYVREHHHFPNKHTSMLKPSNTLGRFIRQAPEPQIKGTLEEWKVEQFREIEGMRDRAVFRLRSI